MMSGAWRSAARSAVGKSGASTPISTCSMTDLRCGCSYSIGSSIVMMWRASRRLISFTSAASVVVLPEPVGPPTSTRPREPRQRFDGRRQTERREPRHHGREAADRRRGAAALVMQVDAEAAEIRRAERAVGDAGLAIHPPRVRRQRGRHRVLDLLAAERPSISPTTMPSMRSDGGAPATSRRSLAARSTTCSSHARRRLVWLVPSSAPAARRRSAR